MATMNISLPDQMKDWVDEQVQGGGYSTASDLVRDLVRREQERRAAIARLQAEIDKGIASGISPLTPDEVFQRARERAFARAREIEEQAADVVAHDR